MDIRACTDTQRKEQDWVSDRSGASASSFYPQLLFEMCFLILPLFTPAPESAPLSSDRPHGRQHLPSYAMQSKQLKERLNLPHYPSPKVPKTHLSWGAHSWSHHL